MKNALIVFAKNPTLGKVKTRLAKSIGDKAALKIYKDFMNLVRNICIDVNADIHWFHSDYISKKLNIDTKNKVQQYKQLKHPDLGERMKDAFKNVFIQRYEKVIIIGIDCPYLNSKSINKAFTKLNESTIVIGPANDGGFYLLGTRKDIYLDFSNILWSTSSVFEILIKNLKKRDIDYKVLSYLDDIDDIDDYNKYMIYRQSNE